LYCKGERIRGTGEIATGIFRIIFGSGKIQDVELVEAAAEESLSQLD
jgi:hypothetical protein